MVWVQEKNPNAVFPETGGKENTTNLLSSAATVSLLHSKFSFPPIKLIHVSIFYIYVSVYHLLLNSATGDLRHP